MISVETVVVVGTNELGDVVNNSPLVDCIRSHFSGCRLVYLVFPEETGNAVLAQDPRIDRIVICPIGGNVKSLMRAALDGDEVASSVLIHQASRRPEYAEIVRRFRSLPGTKFVAFSNKRRIQPYPHQKVLWSLLRNTWVAGKRKLISDVVNLAIKQSPAKTLTEPPKRVLWTPADGLGDLVATLPSLYRLWKAYPNAEVDIIVREGYAGLLKQTPFPWNVLEYEEPGHARRTKHNATWIDTLRLAKFIRMRHYDITFDLSSRELYSQLAYMSGAPIRAGVLGVPREQQSHSKYAAMLNVVNPFPSPVAHKRDQCEMLLDRVGVPKCDDELDFRVLETSASRADVDRLLAEHGVDGDFVIVHTKSVDPNKTWRPEDFACIVQHLSWRRRIQVVLTGGLIDADYNNEILACMAGDDEVYNFAGRCSLTALVSLMARARMMVTVDTGPMHIASALGVPLVALFISEPDFRGQYYPYGQREWVVSPKPMQAATRIQPGPDRAQSPLQCITPAEVNEMIDLRLASLDELPEIESRSRQVASAI